MKLIVLTRFNKFRSVYVPKGDPIPTIVHPEAWVGQGSSHNLVGGCRFDIVIRGSTDRHLYLSEIKGDKCWMLDPDYGVELLHLYPAYEDSAKEAFAQAFLQFWLNYVFGQEIEIEYIELTPSNDTY